MLKSELNIHSILQVQDDDGQWQNIIPAILNNDRQSLTLFGALEAGLGISLPSTPEARGLPVDFSKDVDEGGYYIDMKSFLMATSTIFNAWWLGGEQHSYLYLLEFCKLKFEANKSDSLYRNLDNTTTKNPSAEMDMVVNICRFILSNLIYSHGNFQKASLDKARIVFGFDEKLVDDDSDNENINTQKKSPLIAFEYEDMFIRFIYNDKAFHKKTFSEKKMDRKEIERKLRGDTELSESVESINARDAKRRHKRKVKVTDPDKLVDKGKQEKRVLVPFFTDKQLNEIRRQQAIEEMKKQCTIS